MIDFTNGKSITIPEGSVKQITRKSDGTVLWKSGYKNWARYSTEADGVTIYNGGLGYKKGYRIRSGGAEGTNDYGVCTGFIPFVKGDKLYIYPALTNRNITNAINFYNVSYECLGQATGATIGYGICPNGSYEFHPTSINGVSVLDLSNNTVSGVENIAFVRITHDTRDTTVEDMVITVNEEIE